MFVQIWILFLRKNLCFAFNIFCYKTEPRFFSLIQTNSNFQFHQHRNTCWGFDQILLWNFPTQMFISKQVNKFKQFCFMQTANKNAYNTPKQAIKKGKGNITSFSIQLRTYNYSPPFQDDIVLIQQFLIQLYWKGLLCRPFYSSNWTLSTAHFTLNTAYCKLYTVNCTLHTEHWKLHTYCTLHTTH